MRIQWVLSAANVLARNGQVTSPLASYRYRTSIPLRELKSRGHDCKWFALQKGVEPESATLLDADILIFGKNHIEQDLVLACLDSARANGVPTVVDICDDYFETGAKLESYYRALVHKADLVTTSSAQLAFYIEEATGEQPRVIVDCYEGPRGAPRWRPDRRHVKGLWFGSPGNMQSLIGEAEQLPNRINGYKLDLTVLTSDMPGIEAAFRRFNERCGSKISLRYRQWSLENNWAALGSCDLVVIPVDRNERFYLAKGANRLVEALWAGRFAVVNSIPAYDEFSSLAWVGASIADGISWALAHPADVQERIAAAQTYIDCTHSPAKIASEWEQALLGAI